MELFQSPQSSKPKETDKYNYKLNSIWHKKKKNNKQTLKKIKKASNALGKISPTHKSGKLLEYIKICK